jgi:anti-sigma factor RsiW
MNCTDFDLKGYILEELAADERRGVEQHLRDCEGCQTELERLLATHSALLALKEEEMPRRIAFVSDKVLKPSWWQRFWQSGPRLAFAAAAMLSLAIVLHALVRPAVVEAPATAAFDQRIQAMQAAFDQRLQTEIQARVTAAVDARLSRREAEYQEKLAAAVASAEQRMQARNQQELRAVEDAYEVLRKQNNINYVAAANFRGM